MFPVVYHPHYSITWPKDHRFPMSKFRLLYDYLIAEGIVSPAQVHQPRPVSRATLERVHDPAYLDAFIHNTWSTQVARRVGMSWYPELVTRTFAEVGGAVATARLALRHGIACNTAGGTHHAYADFGSGFCILNDIAVVARLLLDRGEVNRVLVVDLDVHQGDGTAHIFREEPGVFTFSMHGAKNFPFRKQPSDLDIGLESGLGDRDYLNHLHGVLPGLLTAFQPDLVIYDAGVDVHRLDRLGKLALSDEGLLARDHYVLAGCRDAGIPVATLVGGGYSEDRGDLAARHALVFRAAGTVFGTG